MYLHASVVLNVTYWTIYEKFHEMVLQIKTIDKIDKAKSQPISDEGQDAVVASDIVDVHGENFGRSPTSNTSVKEGKKLSSGGKGQENYQNRRRRIMPRK